MPLISLAMIVKNEENTLAHCLESVRSLVDEMIIVDTGSTDNTIAIAEGFGAQVHHFEWRDDFAAARNESLKHCKGDWVLILDADEAIDPLDYEKIRNACIHPCADAYVLICRHYTRETNLTLQDKKAVSNKSEYSEGKNMPFYVDTRITARIVRTVKGLSYSGGIHETLEPSLLLLGMTTAELDAVIHHYGKLFKDREDYKAQYYFMLARRETEKKPKDETAWNNLLQQALAAGQWEIALDAAGAIMKLNVNIRSFVLYSCGQALQALGRHEEAIEYFDLLLRREPEHVLSMLLKGLSCKALGNVDMARQLMTAVIELEPACVPAYGALAEMEFSAKNFDTARRILTEAIKIAPTEPGLYNDLLKIELTRNNKRQAGQDALLGLKNCPDAGGGSLWHRVAAVYLWETGERDAAKSILEAGIKTFPDDPEMVRLCVQVYGALAEVESGAKNFDAARRILTEAIKIAPAEPALYNLLLKIELIRNNHRQAGQDALLGLQNCPNEGGGLWHRLAAVYLWETGERETAKSILESGLKAFPDNPELARLMKIAYTYFT